MLIFSNVVFSDSSQRKGLLEIGNNIYSMKTLTSAGHSPLFSPGCIFTDACVQGSFLHLWTCPLLLTVVSPTTLYSKFNMSFGDILNIYTLTPEIQFLRIIITIAMH